MNGWAHVHVAGIFLRCKIVHITHSLALLLSKPCPQTPGSHLPKDFSPVIIMAGIRGSEGVVLYEWVLVLMKVFKPHIK